jgi:hypothetical protein
MVRGSAADFLIRAVLDEAFRELALADPQRAFEGYDLSEAEQQILRSRDGRLLGLLGEAAGQGHAVVEQPARKATAKPAASSLPSLPEVKLLLRLTPHATQQPDGASKVSYAASLHPWPGDREPKGTDPGSGEQAEGHSDGTPPEMAWVIHIVPTVLDAQETGLKVAYSASIQPLAVGTDGTQPPAREPPRALANSPWNHHLESSAAKAAAQAVRACAPSRRYEKLLELVDALQAGDGRG